MQLFIPLAMGLFCLPVAVTIRTENHLETPALEGGLGGPGDPMMKAIKNELIVKLEAVKENRAKECGLRMKEVVSSEISLLAALNFLSTKAADFLQKKDINLEDRFVSAAKWLQRTAGPLAEASQEVITALERASDDPDQFLIAMGHMRQQLAPAYESWFFSSTDMRQVFKELLDSHEDIQEPMSQLIQTSDLPHNFRRQALDSLLFMPTQRPFRYPLFIVDLKKKCSFNDQAGYQALVEIKALNQKLESTLALSSLMKKFPDDQPLATAIGQERGLDNTQIIKEKSLQKKTRILGYWQTVTLMLTSRHLFILKPHKVRVLPLDNITVKNGNDDHSFVIELDGQQTTLKDTSSSNSEWVSLIKEALGDSGSSLEDDRLA